MRKFKRSTLPALACVLISASLNAMDTDDPLLTKVMIDELEVGRSHGDNPVNLDAEGWVGRDLDKFWIKTEAEYVDGEFEEAELQFLYSRAISTYWDLQAGIRHDFKPDPDETWGTIGVEGLAPGFIESEFAVFIGESGQTEWRLKAEYELLLNRKIVLRPKFDVVAYGKTDSDHLQGSGLAALQAGIRLGYRIRREFTPYVGLVRTNLYGDTADLRTQDGARRNDTRWVVGITVWF